MSIGEVYAWLLGMQNSSIYDAARLAQPDEVVNFKTGDGLEKAFVLANVMRNRTPGQVVTIHSEGGKVELGIDRAYSFCSQKGFDRRLVIQPCK